MPQREFKENMVLCLECYAGKVGAPFGVKLEDEHIFSDAFTTIDGISGVVCECLSAAARRDAGAEAGS